MGLSKGQAMVIDGLFFLMLCGAAAATLLWAGSVYGNKSFEAYRYIYMTDYASGALQVLSNLDYEFSSGSPPVVVPAAWLTELGGYMGDEFNETSNPARYNAMYGRWVTLCSQAPAPLLLTIYTENEAAVRGTRDEPLYWSCGDPSLLELLRNDDGSLNPYKYPYFSSPLEAKSCGTFRCEMEIKIYY